MLKKIIIGVVVSGLVIVGGAYAYRNVIVENSVEHGCAFALGVEAELGSASLNIGGGSLELDDLRISNPDEFSDNYFFKIENGFIKLNTGSVFDDEIIIDTFTLSGISLNIENIDGEGNYSQILNHLKALEPSSSSDSETKLRIGYLAVRDISVSATVKFSGETLFSKEYSVDGFEMTDLGERSLSIADVSRIVFSKLINESVRAGGSLGFDPNAEINKAGKTVVDKAKSAVNNQLKKLGIGGK